MTDSSAGTPTVSRDKRWLGWLLLGALILVGGFLIVQFGGGVSDFVRYDREEVRLPINGEICRGWRFTPRGSTDDFEGKRIQLWSPSTGFLVYDSRTVDGDTIQTTIWNPEGKVAQQTEFVPSVKSVSNGTPPWWWGVEDQTEPSAPTDWKIAPGRP